MDKRKLGAFRQPGKSLHGRIAANAAMHPKCLELNGNLFPHVRILQKTNLDFKRDTNGASDR